MKVNVKKYLEFGKTLGLKGQEKFVKRTKQVLLAIELNPDIFTEAFEQLYQEYPKFRECIEK